MRNLADLRSPLLPSTWREDVIGFDGTQPIIRCPYVTGQDRGTDLAERFDRAFADEWRTS